VEIHNPNGPGPFRQHGPFFRTRIGFAADETGIAGLLSPRPRDPNHTASPLTWPQNREGVRGKGPGESGRPGLVDRFGYLFHILAKLPRGVGPEVRGPKDQDRNSHLAHAPSSSDMGAIGPERRPLVISHFFPH
jgi:hypothetical protein